MRKLPLQLLALAALTVPVSAQDMLAVDWTGQIYALDSYTGAIEAAGVGMFGQNCMARDENGDVWSIGQGSPVSFGFVSRIDNASLTATPMFPCADVRAMAAGSGTTLYMIVYTGQQNLLQSIDTATGVTTTIGFTGISGIQAMTMVGSVLYAAGGGLIGTIDVGTGQFSPTGATSGNIQWIAVRGDGQLVGGGTSLYAIDIASGITTLIASLPVYLRGADTAAFAAPFGSGCAGGTGDVELRVLGSLQPGSVLTTQSIGHTPTGSIIGGVGALAIGLSRTSYNGQSLPLLLDPLIGTQGCYLYTDSVATMLGVKYGTSPVMIRFSIPLPTGLPPATLHLQHLGFDSVPGGLSTSNGVTIRIMD